MNLLHVLIDILIFGDGGGMDLHIRIEGTEKKTKICSLDLTATTATAHNGSPYAHRVVNF